MLDRAAACHLLYFITKREHVVPHRIRRLNELIDSERDNAELIGLLLVYQTYDFTIRVPHNARLVNAFVFKVSCWIILSSCGYLLFQPDTSS